MRVNTKHRGMDGNLKTQTVFENTDRPPQFFFLRCQNLASGGPAGRLVTCSLFPVPCSHKTPLREHVFRVPCSLSPYGKTHPWLRQLLRSWKLISIIKVVRDFPMYLKLRAEKVANTAKIATLRPEMMQRAQNKSDFRFYCIFKNYVKRAF